MKAEPIASGVKVWDLPTRIFHWTLVALIALQFASGEYDLLPMEWHFRLGYATLALILFRVLWGFFGSESARFGQFLRGPVAVLRYLGDSIAQREAAHPGHNPLGGWSVVAMLLCVAVQAASGLFASDDISEFGPLCARVSDATVQWMTRIHKIDRLVLLVLIALHVSAVLLHRVFRRDHLVAAMLHGRKRIADLHAPLRFAPPGRALALAALSAAIVWAIVAWGAAA
ncbi:MAG TPA: cytochrome b/b6 domain-containing protein [Rhodanobacteraceae bacterium]|nr:cytochrome b/b6 domain-containing protein [Rhodanobacteraceae bacterium]